MKKTVITIETTRSAYSLQQIMENYTTLTVGELKEILAQYDNNTPLVFVNDNKYTYGHIYDHFFNTEEINVTPTIEVGKSYAIKGWGNEIIADFANESTYIDSVVTILNEPDESGWVLARFKNFGGEKIVDMFVDIEALSEL